MCKPHVIYAISLAVVSVHLPRVYEQVIILLPSLQVVEGYGVVLTASNKVLSVMRYVNRVHVFLLSPFKRPVLRNS